MAEIWYKLALSFEWRPVKEASMQGIVHAYGEHLAEDRYFENIIAAMKRGGYEMLGRVAIDSNDRKYHVPALFARDTSLFFRLHGKKLIVQMSFCENVREGSGYSCHWHIRAYMVFKPIHALVKMTYDPDRSMFDGSPLDDIPIYGRDSKLMPGKSYGGSCNGDERHILYELSKEESCDSGGMAETIVRALAEVDRFVCDGAFKRLQVTNFPPHYVFPGSERTFWQRFGIKTLGQAVLRPWGSEGIE
jgi:hypothetical protein